MLAAGFETTVNLLGNGIKMLLDHPEQLAKLRERPELWPTAVEEILRLDSPVQMSARVAKADIEVAGMPVCRGELIIIHLAGANRDPEDRSPTPSRPGRAAAAPPGCCVGGRLCRSRSERPAPR